MPWAGVSDVTGLGTLPTFLQTAEKKKVMDQRPDPTPAQLAALKELQAEVERFGLVGRAYRETVVSLVRRDYLRQRRNRDLSFKRQIDQEEKLEDGARAEAIKVFEEFLRRYPADPKYTPDAMFRLGELYFERAAIGFQNEMDAHLAERERLQDQGLPDSHLREPIKDFGPTIELYKQLVQSFPDYGRLDGVYYLIGYCLNEMGKMEDARVAWLSLVCGNKFHYRGESVVSKKPEPAAPKKQEHPALTMDELALSRPKTPFVDPYRECQATGDAKRFFAETWLRIGEYHFDFDFSDHGLELAISAYSKVLTRPEDRNYNLALYKVAWAYYRASRYPEAIDHFSKLVQWSDDERKRTGKAGTELRIEAVQYLGIAFAYDDWNENQITDPVEGLPRGIDRVQDENLLAQDREWTAEVYFQLGNIYFDEAKYADAIDVWRLALKRWPVHYRAPEIQNMIARAFTRDNQMEDAINARAKLSSYAQGTDWWNANMDHPKEQRKAEELAEDSLINTAIYQHQKAQRMRRRCVERKEPDLCRRSQAEYGIAARAYRQYIKNYPNNPRAYELQYNLADALYWSENYEEAAREYAAVRDSNLDDMYLSISARLVVEANKRLMEQAERAGQLQLRSGPPEATGTPPLVRPVPMPERVQRLAQAREVYMARVPPAQDSEGVRDAYWYNNAVVLYEYGYWQHAHQRFRKIFEERCSGPNANETGRVAWLNLRNMAVTLGRNDDVRRLGQELKDKQCSFTSGARKAVDCSDPDNAEEPQCLAGADLTNLRYQDAVTIFSRAEQASGEEQRQLYEAAATELVKAVNAEPNHAQAPLALEKAAIALERTSRFDSAGRLYQRIIDEVGPRKAANDSQQNSLDDILSNAYFRLAFNANRFFDYQRAVENYRLLADSQRFAASASTQMLERRQGALINAAKILEYQQRYSEAAQYYARAADLLQDPGEQRAAQYRVAEMSYKQKRWGYVVRTMKSFIGRYQRDPAAAELVVQAYWRIAEARKALGQKYRDQRRALDDVVRAFASTGLQPGVYAAEYAAEAKFILADEGADAFEKFAIKPGKPRTLEKYVKTVMDQIKAGGNEAKRRAEGYSAIPGYRRPVWTIAAFVQQGRIYELLARGVLNTPFVMPRDLKKKIRRAPADLQDEVKIQVEDRIRQVLDSQVRPIECLAVARYALAARAARAGNLDNEYTRSAIDRINAYGDERIAECIAEAAAQDASFAQYAPGEFARAPRGLNLGINVGISPPPLSRSQP